MSSFFLKVIAVILMTLDHVGEFFPSSPIYLRWVGRASAPIFIFLCVWSMYYTKNRKNYILRLYVFSILMSIIHYILFCSTGMLFVEHPLPNNIFRTLFLLSTIIYVSYEPNLYKRIIYYSIFALWQIFGVFCYIYLMINYSNLEQVITILFPTIIGNVSDAEGSFMIILGIGMNKYKNNKFSFSIFYSCFCLFLLLNTLFNILPLIVEFCPFPIFNGKLELTFFITQHCLGLSPFIKEVSLYDLFTSSYQWMMFSALPLILCYNHSIGKKYKYFFYIYYPLHLIVLWLLSLYFLNLI